MDVLPSFEKNLDLRAALVEVMVEKVDLAVAAVVGIIHFAAQAAPVVIAEVKGELGQV